jgi:hypothetical protein
VIGGVARRRQPARKLLDFHGIAASLENGGSGAAVAAGAPQPLMDFRAAATTELNDLVDRLAAAAEASARTAREHAAAEARAAFDALEARRAELERALQDETRARHALEQAASNARSTYEAVEAERAELERALRDETRARHNLEQTNASLESAKAASDEERETLRALAEEVDEARRDLQARLDDGQRAHRDLQTRLDEADAARRTLQSRLDDIARHAADDAARADARRAEQGRAMRDQAIAFVSGALDHVLALSARFADVSTEDEVLAAIVESLSTEFSRVALFKVTHNRLEALRHIGFDFPSDPTHLIIPHAIDAVLARAVTSGQVEVLPADALTEMAGTPFGGNAACALTLPVDLEGDACAVAYADDSDQPHQAFANPELRRKFALLLRQIALPLLARLPAEEKAIAELRDYAALLVAELENLYGADVAAGRKGQELRRRLHDNLTCAQDIYAQRVLSEPAAVASLLEQQLASVVSRTRNTPFGKDLAALVGTGEPLALKA